MAVRCTGLLGDTHAFLRYRQDDLLGWEAELHSERPLYHGTIITYAILNL